MPDMPQEPTISRGEVASCSDCGAPIMDDDCLDPKGRPVCSGCVINYIGQYERPKPVERVPRSCTCSPGVTSIECIWHGGAL